MTLSMYQASVPVFVRALENFMVLLDKAEAHAQERKIDEKVLTGARLFADMLPLTKQVQIASDTTKGAAARLAGLEVPSYADTETTFAELKERLAKTIAFIKGVAAEKIDGSEDREIVLKTGGKEVKMAGQPYLLKFVLPNLFFHVAIAHGILRKNGVSIGKMDYLGDYAA